ncbi:hypothetical protein ACTFIW_002520 [Dictyostelium discoideum]
MTDKINLSILILTSIILAVANSQTQPKTLTMTATVYDQHIFYNDNFDNQGPAYLTKNMVVSKLDKTLKYPQLVSLDVDEKGKTGVNYHGTMYNPKLFKYFFSENSNASPDDKNSGKNFPLLMDLILTLNETSGAYEFSKQEYFPINNKGFNDPSYKVPPNYKAVSPNVDWFKMAGGGYSQNNYNYCIKLNSKFTYFNKGEVFNFRGDDDVWVFIDNRLVVDLGGLHIAETANIKLKDITNPPLQTNRIYDLDFFYCERRATGSSIQLSTTLEIFCVDDYCGVCNGDGTSCCTSSTCEDNNACTIDKCPKLGSVAEGKFTKDDCVYSEVVCPIESNQCLKPYCDPKQGCKTSPVECESGNIDKCFEKSGSCDSSLGCQYNYKCNAYGKCNLGCDGGQCKVKTSEQCSEEFGNDPCYTYSCDVEFGCVRTEKCSQEDAKLCTINTCIKNVTSEDDRCKPVSIQEECNCCADQSVDPCQLPGCGEPGECKPVDKIIDDNNLCTIDKCENGTITHNPVKCGGCSQCDLTTGECVVNPPICDDDNVCTVDSCSLVKNLNGSIDGVCSNKLFDCASNDTDLCNIWTCDANNGGCQSIKKVCDDPSPCLVSKCEPSTGQCVDSPRTCDHGGAFCLISECDERLGCIVYNRQCDSDNRKCQAGVCVNGTSSEEGHCTSVDYDPLPFGCNTAAVVSTAVIAGVTVAAVVGLGIFLYGGKKGYDYYQDNKSKGMTGANSNPLYKESDNAGQNPLYNDNNL